MTDRLQEIKDRWESAAPGPWKRSDKESLYYDFVHILGPQGQNLLTEPTATSISGSWSTGDATDGTYDAVAAAPEDIAWLVAEVERLRGLLNPESPQKSPQSEQGAI